MSWAGCVEAMGPMLMMTVARFATDEALAEIHRVLKPGGVFGMIWNIDECESRRRRGPRTSTE